MNPLRLSIKGINSFEEAQVVDFSRLSSNGIFGIFGPTGSGKSTILDAMTLALYGKVPRYTSYAGRTAAFINVHSKTAAVSFTFEIRRDGVSERYVAERAFKHTTPKRDAAGRVSTFGYNTSVTRLYRIDGEKPEIIEDRTADRVTESVEGLIGLNYQDFIRSVVLPQGSFSEFLLLRNTERRNMLERIFDLGEYGGLHKQINEYYYKTQSRLEALKAAAAAYDEYSEDELERARDAAGRLETVVKAYERHHRDAEARLEASRRLKYFAREYLRAQADLDELGLQSGGMEQRTAALIATQKAGALLPFITECRDLEARGVAARAAYEDASARYNEIAVRLEAAQSAYASARERRETELPVLMARIEKLRQCAELEKAVNEMMAEREALLTEYHAKRRTRDDDALKLAALDEGAAKYREQTALLEIRLAEVKVSPGLRATADTGTELERNTDRLRLESGSAKTARLELEKVLYIERKALSTVSERLTGLDTELCGKRAELEEINERYREYGENLRGREALERAKLMTEIKRGQDELSEAEHKMKALERTHAAFLLATSLHDREPCPVCGSLEHPLPAAPPVGDVTGLTALCQNIRANVEESREQLLSFALEPERDVVEAYERNAKERSGAIEQLETTRHSWTLEKAQLEERVAKAYERLNESITALELAESAYQAAFTSLDALREQIGQRESFTSLREDIRRNDKQREVLDAEQLALSKTAEAAAANKLALSERINAAAIELSGIITAGREKQRFIEDNKRRLEELYAGQSGDIAEVEQLISQLTQNENEAAKAREDCERLLRDSAGCMSGAKGEATQLNGLSVQKRGNLAAMLQDSLFAGEDAVLVAYLNDDERSALEREIEAYNANLTGAKNRFIQSESGLNGRAPDDVEKETIWLEGWSGSIKDSLDEARGELAVISERIRVAEQKLVKQNAIKRERSELEVKSGYAALLAGLFKGNKFVEFVALRYLKHITIEASQRLRRMTSGRFSIELSDADFIIRDDFNGGARRPPSALSGGELFMASLCLALALSSQIQMRSNSDLSFFFLDEGFGSLDADLLEKVMDALEHLKYERMTVGLISHVETLKTRIADFITVVPGEPGCGSRIIQA